jgi:spermidine synthase
MTYLISVGRLSRDFYFQVLIVGGGDGGVAREVAKHPDVESIVQVEIDSRVLDVSKKFLPFMGVGLTNPKLTLHVGDGFRFMAQHRHEFDVIITDSSDPVGMYIIDCTRVYLFVMQLYHYLMSCL